MDLLCISSGKEQSDEGKESERNPCLMKRRCRIPESISVIEVLIIWILYSVASVDQAYNIDQQIPELEIQKDRSLGSIDFSKVPASLETLS